MHKKVAALLTLATLWLAPLGHAEAFKIWVAKSMSVPVVDQHVHAYVARLNQALAAQNLAADIQHFNAEGHAELLARQLTEALAQGVPDVMVSSATLASIEVRRFVLAHELDTPQVYFTITDPWSAGLFDQPRPPVTGVPYYIPAPIKLSIARRLLSPAGNDDVLRLGFVHSSYPSSISDRNRLMAASRGQPFELIPIAVPYRAIGEHLDEMLAEVRSQAQHLAKGVDAWWLAKGPLGERAETARLLLSLSDKPVLYGNSAAAVGAGALFYINPSAEEIAQKAARATLKFLTHPSQVQDKAVLPEKYELFFNLDSSLKHQIIIPHDLLEIAIQNRGLIRKSADTQMDVRERTPAEGD